MASSGNFSMLASSSQKCIFADLKTCLEAHVDQHIEVNVNQFEVERLTYVVTIGNIHEVTK